MRFQTLTNKIAQ